MVHNVHRYGWTIIMPAWGPEVCEKFYIFPFLFRGRASFKPSTPIATCALLRIYSHDKNLAMKQMFFFPCHWRYQNQISVWFHDEIGAIVRRIFLVWRANHLRLPWTNNWNLATIFLDQTDLTSTSNAWYEWAAFGRFQVEDDEAFRLLCFWRFSTWEVHRPRRPSSISWPITFVASSMGAVVALWPVGGFHAPAQKKPADIPAVTHFLFPFPLDFVARVFPSACYEHSDVCS